MAPFPTSATPDLPPLDWLGAAGLELERLARATAMGPERITAQGADLDRRSPRA